MGFADTEAPVDASERPNATRDYRNRRRRESHARIRSAARSLFRERGVDATTVDEIAAQAEVSQKTFFNHFATKDALLRELARSVLAHFERLLAEECKRTDRIEARLEGFFLAVAAEVETARVLTRDLLHQIIRGSGAEGVGSDELRRIREGFREVVAEGRLRGEVCREGELDFQADVLAGAFIGVVLQWLNEPGYPLRGRLRETARFVCAALASGPVRRREI